MGLRVRGVWSQGLRVVTSPARHRFGQGGADSGVGAGSRNGLSRLLVLLKALQPGVGTVDMYCHRKHAFGDSRGPNGSVVPLQAAWLCKGSILGLQCRWDEKLLPRGQYN